MVACTDQTNWKLNHHDRQPDHVLNCYPSKVIAIVKRLAADPSIHAVVAIVHWGGQIPLDQTRKHAGDAESDDAIAKGYSNAYVRPRGKMVCRRQTDCAKRSFARELAEAGAVAIVATHPHVLHGWERYITSHGRDVLITATASAISIAGMGSASSLGPFMHRGVDSEEVKKKPKRASLLITFAPFAPCSPFITPSSSLLAPDP